MKPALLRGPVPNGAIIDADTTTPGAVNRRERTHTARSDLAPFLKWAGGKRSLVPELLRHVPEKVNTYYEPFLGGGALFFALLQLPGPRRFRRAVLWDTNGELISCYRAIREDVTGVLDALEEHREGEEHYYRVRDQNPARLSDAKRAARTIYLNRNGFNGLYRVNRSGLFNVPFGKHASLQTMNADRLRAVSDALRDVSLEVGDFFDCVKPARPRDFVYFDPPYVPLSRTSNFTDYSITGFGEAQQQRLAELLRELGRKKIPALLSNSDCAATRALYEGMSIGEVRVARLINSNGSGRGRVSELLVRSWPYPC